MDRPWTRVVVLTALLLGAHQGLDGRGSVNRDSFAVVVASRDGDARQECSGGKGEKTYQEITQFRPHQPITAGQPVLSNQDCIRGIIPNDDWRRTAANGCSSASAPASGPAIRIAKTHNSLQGHYELVSVTTENAALAMGGLDFLISYNAAALGAVEVTQGQLLRDCRWEYFTYRLGPPGNCGGPCPSGFVRIIAIADINNGGNHPSCFGPPDADSYQLARIKFFVNSDPRFDCQLVPLNFYWLDCGDNGISSVTGETLYVESRIYDFSGSLVWDEADSLQFPDSLRLPGVGIADDCLIGDKLPPIRLIEFWNGGIGVACADSIDLRGDLNLNGIANEIADAITYTNYFMLGLKAFPVIGRDGAVAASDVNADHRTLTVGDLIYLLRIITGDAVPFAKLAPFAQSASVTASVNHRSVTVATDAQTEIGAGYFVFQHPACEIGEPYLANGASQMTLEYHDEDDILRVLIYGAERGKKICARAENLFVIPVKGQGSVSLMETQLSDYYGNLLVPSIEKRTTLPANLALQQNYPNPFNAMTQIRYELPATGHTTLEVFNIVGQKVAALVDEEQAAGVYTVEWNGRDQTGREVASGVYFYCISAGDFRAERKMVLLK